MNNLLFLALLLIISIVICYYFYEAEKESFREIDGVKMWLDRCKTYNEMKVKMNNPSCGVDDRCDHIKIGVKEDIVLEPSGEIKIEESPSYSCEPINKTVIDLEDKPKDLLTQDNFKIENMDVMNSSEEPIEKMIKYCKDPARTCEDLGANCGYCDKGELGSFKFTNRGSEGSGYKDSLGNISTDDGRPCEGDNWVYGDVEKCKKRRGQRACSQIKSCDDFEKYPGLDGLCGYCPTLGKAVPIEVIGDKNVPRYIPEDSCVGGEEIEKYGTLNARQCTQFMNENPCIRPQYWSGIPDHSPECYKKLYRQAGGSDSNKDEEWWANESNRSEFDMARSQLSSDAKLPNGEQLPPGYAPIPWLLNHFKNYAERIKDKCYTKANKSWNWLTGYKYDPCVHQDDTGYGNRECQRTREGQTDDMLKTGTVSDYMNYYNVPHCDGFKNREGFVDFKDWLNQNRPEILREREAQEWYQETKARAPDKFKDGGETYKQYLKEIQQVMYSGKTYEKRKKATHLLKGMGFEPPAPPEIKEGDYVELIAKEHVYRGVLYRLKDFDGVKKALVMWDFYYNNVTNARKNRGPTMGVCLKEHNNETHSEGDCIEGISAHLNNDTSACENKSENKKLSCLVPTNFNVMTRGQQRYTFGYPQYPSIKASSPNNPFEDKGWIDVGYLSVLRRCKPSSEDCSSTDYNCETSLEAVNEYYKKPQDCDYELSDYSECSKECGGGTQYRTFKINLPAKGEDGLACPYGNNQRGYTERVEERACNTHECSPDARRMVRLRWCGVGGENDPNCVGINRFEGNNGTCYSMSPVDEIRHEGRRGDFMNIAKCRDIGGVWDAGSKLLADGAHFYLDPVHANSQDKRKASIYRFRWRPDNDGGQSFSESIGLRKDYRDMCLHPNVNSIEIGGNEGVKWGRGDRSRFGPTHARNDNVGDNPNLVATFYKHCYYGGWSKSLGVGRYSYVGNVGIQNDDMSSLKVPRGLKVTLYQHSNFNGSKRTYDARNGNIDVPCLVWTGFNDVVSSIIIEKSSSNTRPNEWNGLGRIGDCNSPYAEIQIERMDKGDKFRLKRENFTGSIKEGWCNSPRESRRAQIPGRGHYMGVKLNAWEYGAASSEWDRFYKNEKESVHKFDCDMNPDTAEKRVGLFKCSGGSKDGKKYPFLTNNAFCSHIDPLRNSGFTDSQLICKEDCETKGGKCNFQESEWSGNPYFVINADNSSSMYGANSRWRWSNSRIVLGGQGYKTGDRVSVESPNSTRRAQGHPTWKNKAKLVPNISVREIKIEFDGKEQGWGNPTAGPRLVLWSGNRVIYDKYVGGRSRGRGPGKGILRVSYGNLRKNTQIIPYTEFISGQQEVVTHAVLILREQGSGHEATVQNAKISFNPTASF